LTSREQEEYWLDLIAKADAAHSSSQRKDQQETYHHHIERRHEMATQGTIAHKPRFQLEGFALVSMAVLSERQSRQDMTLQKRGGPPKKTTRKKPFTTKGRKPKSLDHHGTSKAA